MTKVFKYVDLEYVPVVESGTLRFTNLDELRWKEISEPNFHLLGDRTEGEKRLYFEDERFGSVHFQNTKLSFRQHGFACCFTGVGPKDPNLKDLRFPYAGCVEFSDCAKLENLVRLHAHINGKKLSEIGDLHIGWVEYVSAVTETTGNYASGWLTKPERFAAQYEFRIVLAPHLPLSAPFQTIECPALSQITSQSALPEGYIIPAGWTGMTEEASLKTLRAFRFMYDGIVRSGVNVHGSSGKRLSESVPEIAYAYAQLVKINPSKYEDISFREQLSSDGPLVLWPSRIDRYLHARSIL